MSDEMRVFIGWGLLLGIYPVTLIVFVFRLVFLRHKLGLSKLVFLLPVVLIFVLIGIPILFLWFYGFPMIFPFTLSLMTIILAFSSIPFAVLLQIIYFWPSRFKNKRLMDKSGIVVLALIYWIATLYFVQHSSDIKHDLYIISFCPINICVAIALLGKMGKLLISDSKGSQQ
tara:strand:+ start:25952 stop:26467 length:516 start_codon:yes stop_codon:yes gene_type:complete